MNKLIIYICVFISGWVLSCKESDYLMFNEIDRIQFAVGAEDKVIYYTFVYFHSDTTELNIKIKVELMGDMSDIGRKFKIIQVEDYDWIYDYDDFGNKTDSTYLTYKNAVPNVHYYPLNEEYILKADSVIATIPIIAIRDTTLMTSEYRLRLKLVATDDLPLGESSMIETRISISDILQEPSSWSLARITRSLGEYSQVKHRFMIDLTGLLWNDETISEQIPSTNSAAGYDWNLYFKEELRKLNELNGKSLTDENGKIVTF